MTKTKRVPRKRGKISVASCQTMRLAKSEEVDWSAAGKHISDAIVSIIAAVKAAQPQTFWTAELAPKKPVKRPTKRKS